MRTAVVILPRQEGSVQRCLGCVWRSTPCFLSTTYSIMPSVSFRDLGLAPTVLLLLQASLQRRPLSSNAVRRGRCHGLLGNSFHQTEKRVHMTCHGQTGGKHLQDSRLLHHHHHHHTTTTPPPHHHHHHYLKYSASALEAAPRRGLLLPLLPRGLRVSVPEVRRYELGERARVLG